MTSGALLSLVLIAASPPEVVETDLLVVGGSESAVAAAVEAGRLGVKSVTLVNDIDWLGGQFTSEGLGAVDEWTIYDRQRVPFPRSGIFLEIMDRIERGMQQRYGLARPGNSFCAWTTCEPRETERTFRRFVAPYLKEKGGPLVIRENYEPGRVLVEGGSVREVEFVSTRTADKRITVRAKLTIDASDWGDVVRLSGARYLRGPDLQSRFGEPGAPTTHEQVHPNELNPITWCLVLRESDEPATIDRPPHYDERKYYGTTVATRAEYNQVGWPPGTMGPFTTAWRDSTMPGGPYSETPTVYTHRRLVDRRHLKLAPGTELVLVNWPLQDYPTYNFPKYLVDRLEANEPGASNKNLVDMTPSQRRLVFQDAKDHALGMFYHLQTTVHDKEPNSPVSFRNMKLTDEFGTPDRLPPKPYVREGLRLESLYMVREQDIRDTDGVQSWAPRMVPDNCFGFQFNIDFHPTRRIFLSKRGDNTGPWAHIHSEHRNWSTHTDRAGFPLRSLIPVEMDGLLVAGKNLGLTSIVSAAVRLHGHGMHAGQAAAAAAAVCLDQRVRPRDLVRNGNLVRRVQTLLVDPPRDAITGNRVPGVLLWPYQDLRPDAEHFVAANQLAIRAILPGEPGRQDFQPGRVVSRREAARALCRAALDVGRFDAYQLAGDDRDRAFSDVTKDDPDRAAIESLVRWKLLPAGERFDPDGPATFGLVGQMLDKLGWPVPGGEDAAPLTRAKLALVLWDAIATHEQPPFPALSNYLTMDHDADGDGVADREDALPLDRDNDSLPDRLDPD